MGAMGSMADFDAMLHAMHQRGIKVDHGSGANHTSDEHPWFQQSRSSRSNPYRDYYHWCRERGTPAARWSFFDRRQRLALRFDHPRLLPALLQPQAAHLKWENRGCGREVYHHEVLVRQGLDGFRMDVIPFISRHDLPAAAAAYRATTCLLCKGPRILREMNRTVLSKYDVMTWRGRGVTVDDALKFVAEDRHELQTFFQFELVDRWAAGRATSFIQTAAPSLRLSSRSLPSGQCLATSGWGTVFLGNHDQSRMVSRYGNDAPRYRNVSAKMLHTLLLTMRARRTSTTAIDRMANIRFTDIGITAT